MDTALLFRKDYSTEPEFEVAKKYFNVFENRVQCKDSLIVCRYSGLPYYKELEKDLAYNGCKLINTYEQHKWIADFDYYQELKDFTPETWYSDEIAYVDYDGPFVLKGKTNSFKQKWNELMFAENKQDAIKKSCRLLDHAIAQQQGIIFRKYVPLKSFGESIGGLPVSNEWRFFFLGNTMLSYGYYFANTLDQEYPEITDDAIEFAKSVAKIASEHVNFFVVDIAEKEEGGWVLIELNDGQQSGLSDNDPDELYSSLKKALV